jgi:hypothetical protein
MPSADANLGLSRGAHKEQRGGLRLVARCAGCHNRVAGCALPIARSPKQAATSSSSSQLKLKHTAHTHTPRPPVQGTSPRINLTGSLLNSYTQVYWYDQGAPHCVLQAVLSCSWEANTRSTECSRVSLGQ